MAHFMRAPHRFYWWARKQHQATPKAECIICAKAIRTHVFIRGFSGTWNHFSRCVQLIRARIVVTAILLRTKLSGEQKKSHTNWLRSSMKFSVSGIEILRRTYKTYTRMECVMCWARKIVSFPVFGWFSHSVCYIGRIRFVCILLYAFHSNGFHENTELHDSCYGNIRSQHNFILVWKRIFFWSRLFVRSVQYG